MEARCGEHTTSTIVIRKLRRWSTSDSRRLHPRVQFCVLFRRFTCLPHFQSGPRITRAPTPHADNLAERPGAAVGTAVAPSWLDTKLALAPATALEAPPPTPPLLLLAEFVAAAAAAVAPAKAAGCCCCCAPPDAAAADAAPLALDTSDACSMLAMRFLSAIKLIEANRSLSKIK